MKGMQNRGLTSMVAASLTALMVAASCASTEDATESERIRIARAGLERGAQLPQEPVQHSGASSASHMASTLDGLKLLKHLDKPRTWCSGGTIDVYEVTNDSRAVWDRMLRSADTLTTAQKKATGRRIRFLRASGDDYVIDAALTQPSHHGALLAVLTCG